MTEEEPMSGEDAQQFHDRMVAEAPPRTKEQDEALIALVDRLRSRSRLESEGWSGLVDRVAERHGMTRAEAIEAIIDFGG